ncbi:Fe-S cluster assembly protein HesB [Microbacterium sp. NEAU-LLC]|uniref:Fe-S cluster assembly protein HesB n=1 Tax=Microbacterium helvum TaxID=2773713 RepID=A0ABR8NJ95_9MICO|nr:Fe-S cluster assembly protein HesB [Microbacterium helvum]MBD3940502.1 Fe-S cluster assembly protein HesB [Microbacterium helvum]
MLTLTDNAATLISGFVRSQGRNTRSGIRIRMAGGDHAHGLNVEYAAAPSPADEIVERNGARVFLDSSAALYLASKELDATFRNGMVDLTVHDRG